MDLLTRNANLWGPLQADSYTDTHAPEHTWILSHSPCAADPWPGSKPVLVS